MGKGETLSINPVSAEDLERAFLSCAEMIKVGQTSRSAIAANVLDVLRLSLPLLENEELIDVFRRLCLMSQTIEEIDGNTKHSLPSSAHINGLPFAMFELVSGETAFEETDGGRLTLFFARDILPDAMSILRNADQSGLARPHSESF